VKWRLLLAAIGAVVLGFVLLGRLGSPYNGPAVHAPLCGKDRLAEKLCRSPDGRWTAQYGPSGLVLTGAGGTRRTLSSYENCCGEIAWARPHRLVYTGDGGFSAYAFDPGRGKETYLGDFSNIYASPDGRWVLGDLDTSDLGHPRPYLGGLVSLATGRCFAVPGNPSIGEDSGPFETGFTPDGTAVVVGPAGNRRRLPISSLRQPCDPLVLR